MKEEVKSQLRTNIETLMFGSRADFKETKKNIKKLWHHNSQTFQKIAPFVLEYILKFDEIKKPENRAAFISGIDLFFLSLADDYFEELKNLTIKAIQDQNGSVRQAMVHAFSWLKFSLIYRTKLRNYEKLYLKKRSLNDREIATKQFVDLVQEIEALIEKYNDENEIAEYVDEMKPSINKSLQMLWHKLTNNSCYRKLIEETQPVSSEIFFKRKEIEAELAKLLKKSKSFADVDFIKDHIFNESESHDFQELIMLFDTGYQSGPEIPEVLEVITDAWNYFPHKHLNGLCPVEMVDNEV